MLELLTAHLDAMRRCERGETAREKLRRRLRARLRPSSSHRARGDDGRRDDRDREAIVDSSSGRDDVATRFPSTTRATTTEGLIRASRLDLVLAACALEGETASAVRRGLARETALTRLTADARAFEASASALERGLRRMESKKSTSKSKSSIDGRHGRSRRCGGSSSRRTRRRARSSSRARPSNLDDDADEETGAREDAESDDEDVDASLDAAARSAAARFLRRVLASGREYAR